MAATNINRVIITGNLTRDPELRSTAAARRSAACASRSTAAARTTTGQWVDKPNYFDVTVWGAQGENCAQYLAKGRPVAVDGRLNWREWEAQDGAKRQSVDIIADSVQFLGSRDAAADRTAWSSPTSRPTPPTSSQAAVAAAARTTTSRSRHRTRAAGARHPTTRQVKQAVGKTQRHSTDDRQEPVLLAGGRRKSCHFCRDKVDQIDYKDFQSLRRYLSDKGKIRSRRITGACRRHQNQLANAVKRARELALLPYVSER